MEDFSCMKNRKKKEKCIQSKRPVGHHQAYNMHITGVPDKKMREKWAGRVFEVIMTKSFTTLMKDINLHIIIFSSKMLMFILIENTFLINLNNLFKGKKLKNIITRMLIHFLAKYREVIFSTLYKNML